MQYNPLISVVMSVYDTPDDWLIQSIESVLEQSYGNFEFIIVDDCCCESNKKILIDFRNRDKRIVVLCNEKNIGLTKSLNKGIAFAKGDFIARIDADDVAEQNRFALQIENFKRNEKLVLCGSQLTALDGQTEYPLDVPLGRSKILKSTLCWKNVFAHPSVMMRASVLRENGILYDESFKTAQDYELWCRLCVYGEVMNLPNRLCGYRIHGKQISQNLSSAQNFSRNRVILKNLRKIGIRCDEKDLVDYLAIMGHEKNKVGSIQLIIKTFILCYRMLCYYGLSSRSSIQNFLWVAFWKIKHNVCGDYFRFYSRRRNENDT